MREAEASYLGRVAEDCAAVLGPGITVLGIEQTALEGGVRLALRFEAAGAAHETAAEGRSVVDAHASLRAQLIHDRLAVGFAALISRQ
jgi:hypothetical protein